MNSATEQTHVVPFIDGGITLADAIAGCMWLTCHFVMCKTHVVPAFLFDQLVEDLALRGNDFIKGRRHTGSTVDQIVSPGQLNGKLGKFKKVQVGGYVMLVPPNKCNELARQLVDNPVRAFGDDVAYRKLYAPMHCWVIPEEWRKPIINMMYGLSDKVDNRGSV